MVMQERRPNSLQIGHFSEPFWNSIFLPLSTALRSRVSLQQALPEDLGSRPHCGQFICKISKNLFTDLLVNG